MLTISQEKEILSQEKLQKIAESIRGPEEQQRREAAFRRFTSWSGDNETLVRQRMGIMFKRPSTADMVMANSSNLNITKKIIDKLAKVYSNGVVRTIGEIDSEETAKINSLEKKLKANNHLKIVSKLTKLDSNGLSFIKPIEMTNDNGEIENAYVDLIPMADYTYSVITHDKDKKKVMALIFSDHSIDSNILINKIDSGDKAHTAAIVDAPKGAFSPVAKAKSDEEEVKVEAKEELFVLWSKDYHFTFNQKGEIKNLEMNDDSAPRADQVINKFGFIPAKFWAHDQTDQFWVPGKDNLIDGCVKINVMITNNDHTAFKQGHGQFYMKGKGLSRDIETGPDVAIIIDVPSEMENSEFEIGYVNANAPLADLERNVERQVSLVLSMNNLSTKGVSTKLEAGAEASGVALIIDKAESIEDVEDQQQTFLDGEPEFWQKINDMNMHYKNNSVLDETFEGCLLSETLLKNDLSVVLGMPRVIMSEKDTLDVIEKRQELGLNTKVELIQKDRKGLGAKEAQKVLDIIEAEAEIKEEKSAQDIDDLKEDEANG